ncbi:fibrobacter succinogenes major paralogous domain-containing protein [Spirosoma sp. BT702]|uniref:Fibrobacter succinogenes major paralogous domain-containing protein n=1 Tax=Spirosoma profusum TaxID=2771354 RepID=A0A926XZ69_9BACT|nr:fibrobacter succinogenes major paralogous domain-containing protein [Spirosoma profusum]MBD2703522.1 fibrobacter succinogenes major paralogous domain-containing protein [Spirosoma profusum]
MNSIRSWWIAIFLLMSMRSPVPTVPLKSALIGTQEWTTENLNISQFRNGEPVFEANTYDAWEKACIDGKPAWCYVGNDPKKGKQYGKLYNFWAVVDKRKLAPEGWHVPSDEEWNKLIEQLGGVDEAGKSLKAKEGWKNGGNGTNTSQFGALPGGYRSHEGSHLYGGPFFEAGSAGYWWSTTKYLVDNVYCRSLSYKDSRVRKSSFVMTTGLAVRLVKDSQ